MLQTVLSGTSLSSFFYCLALQVWQAPAGLQDSLYFQHGKLSPSLQHFGSPQRGGQSDGLLHTGLSLSLLPAPPLGVGCAEQPGAAGGVARRRSHPVHAVRVSPTHCSASHPVTCPAFFPPYLKKKKSSRSFYDSFFACFFACRICRCFHSKHISSPVTYLNLHFVIVNARSVFSVTHASETTSPHVGLWSFHCKPVSITSFKKF